MVVLNIFSGFWSKIQEERCGFHGEQKNGRWSFPGVRPVFSVRRGDGKE